MRNHLAGSRPDIQHEGWRDVPGIEMFVGSEKYVRCVSMPE
jgi:hypothetical protein